jgi:hypothetical protein
MWLKVKNLSAELCFQQKKHYLGNFVEKLTLSTIEISLVLYLQSTPKYKLFLCRNLKEVYYYDVFFVFTKHGKTAANVARKCYNSEDFLRYCI